MQETWVQSLGWEDSPGEENGNPLQYFCLENPTDRGAWSATVHGVAMSQILKNNNLATMGASLVDQLVQNPPAMQENPGSIPGSGRSPGEGVGYPLQYCWVSLVTQLVKNPPAIQETWA